MSLSEKQRKFTLMIADLILWAHASGFELTFGDAYRDPRCSYGHPKSLHRKRLAVDLNLFRGGQFMANSEDHRPLGEYWESMGGTWGGRWGDGNHYSIEHEGMK